MRFVTGTVLERYDLIEPEHVGGLAEVMPAPNLHEPDFCGTSCA